MLAEASLAVFSVMRKFWTLPSAMISKVTEVVPMLIRSAFVRRVIIPARPDRVFEQFLISSLRRADRIHGRAAAIVDPAADDRLLLQIPVAGGRVGGGFRSGGGVGVGVSVGVGIAVSSSDSGGEGTGVGVWVRSASWFGAAWCGAGGAESAFR